MMKKEINFPYVPINETAARELAAKRLNKNEMFTGVWLVFNLIACVIGWITLLLLFVRWIIN
jgi:hypothetical protein